MILAPAQILARYAGNDQQVLEWGVLERQMGKMSQLGCGEGGGVRGGGGGNASPEKFVFHSSQLLQKRI